MTRPRSVKYTSALVRVLPDLAPMCVMTTAGNGQTEETRPRVSRSRVGSTAGAEVTEEAKTQSRDSHPTGDPMGN